MTAVILAAGEGTRMKSNLPKVLHRAGGRPLLGHVLAALQPLEASCVVVVSKSGERIRDALAAAGFVDLAFVVQDPPRGTGDAARLALRSLDPAPGTVLIVHGDTPLIETTTLRAVLDAHRRSGAAATMLTATVDDPTGLGRILRDGDDVVGIVEEPDATDEQLAITEVNASVYAFEVDRVSPLLDRIDSQNAKGEYYLTDLVAILRTEGETIRAVTARAHEAAGVNSRSQLAHASEVLRRRVCDRWLDEGVTIMDPATTYIDATVEIGKDAVIMPFTFLEGSTVVGPGAEIGPQVRIVDSEIGEDSTVSFAVVRGSIVGPNASVGPFASLRPGTRLEEGSRAGTFVEMKQTRLGKHSKANHLAYLGDAEIGSGVNVGAGTITCNWDGVSKHKTILDDDVYIGSDTMLVAPVHIHKGGATGAGAVVRGDVPEGALAVGVPARIVRGKGNKMVNKTSTEPPDGGE